MRRGTLGRMGCPCRPELQRHSAPCDGSLRPAERRKIPALIRDCVGVVLVDHIKRIAHTFRDPLRVLAGTQHRGDPSMAEGMQREGSDPMPRMSMSPHSVPSALKVVLIDPTSSGAEKSVLRALPRVRDLSFASDAPQESIEFVTDGDMTVLPPLGIAFLTPANGPPNVYIHV